MQIKLGSRWFGYVMTLSTALLGAYLFKLIHAPIPWLLGPLISVLVASNVWKGRYYWPVQIRNTGMIIVGYTIGLSMTAAALKEMLHQLPYMLVMTILLLILCGTIAYMMSKIAKIDYRTALLASVPGGLTQVIMLAEETKGVNLAIVTVTQVIRLMIIIVCVPLLLFSPVFGHTHAATAISLPSTAAALWPAWSPRFLIFALACIACAWIGSKIKLPTAYLLGPVLATAILNLSGIHAEGLSPLIINAAQLMLGAYVGLMLKPDGLKGKVRTLLVAVTSGLVLLMGAWGLSSLLTLVEPISTSTALLSLAPGGMDQMGILAHEVHADLSMVAGFQMFRIFFIFFATPPLLRYIMGLKSVQGS